MHSHISSLLQNKPSSGTMGESNNDMVDKDILGVARDVLRLSKYKSDKHESTFDVSDDLKYSEGSSLDKSTVSFDEIQRVQFRHARRLKRIETLEREIMIARAQNDALRVALESARCASGGMSAEVINTDGASLHAHAVQPAIVQVRSRNLSALFLRLFRIEKRDGGLNATAVSASTSIVASID